MYKFGKQSLSKLSTCHPDLQRLMNEVIKIYDCSIIEGHRGEDKQQEAFYNSKSKLQWPNSKHNSLPSLAVDVIPYPLKSWEDLEEFAYMAGIIMATAKHLDIKIRWGGHFKNFKDMPHFELVEVTSKSGTKSEITPKEHLPSGPSNQEIRDRLKSKES